MSRGARTAITLSVLCVVLAIAGLWGWTAAMKPLPAKVDTPICVDKTIDAGEKVFPQDVTISVYNASDRDGLAGRTMQLLTDVGFAEGSSGNVPGQVGVVQIWTLDPESPAVALVASHLGDDVEVQRRQPPGDGVAVVVGDDFEKLVKGKKAVVVESDAEICSPPIA
ncbi:LytR C-terminal domain-containing protein [Nocardioides sp. SR21]|uniref:LytR C-terminal domain-containing protein n=1 Tax=Nocardioides sp. SR21 TaxID=2919501 RepID=UPI001FA9F9EE|nr:LytR C-terminal domain-containing protein [Nocardioides sp. SR21]